MLQDIVKKGVVLSGLSSIMTSAKPAFTGSYSVEMSGCLFPSVSRIHFTEDASGIAIAYLPYRPQMNADVNMAGGEVISGEFTGCIMAIYRAGESLKANHVDTAKYDGNQPHKDAWQTAKEGFADGDLKNEANTSGVLPAYIERKGNAVRQKFGAGLRIICIASAAEPYKIMQLIVYKNAKNEYEIRKVL